MKTKYRYILEGYIEDDDHTSFFLRDTADGNLMMIVLEDFRVVLLNGKDRATEIEEYELVNYENLDNDTTKNIRKQIGFETADTED